MSRASNFVKNYPSMQVSSALTGSFTTPSAPIGGENPTGSIAVMQGGTIATLALDGISSNSVYSQYINIASAGNSILFSDVSRRQAIAVSVYGGGNSANSAVGSTTRMVIAQGEYGGGYLLRAIEYLEFATKGTAQKFGVFDKYGGYRWTCSSSTRGIFGGGNLSTAGSFGGVVNTINYVTMATLGNSTSFGTMVSPSDELIGCSSTTRGIFGGNDVALVYGRSVDVEYITIATTGNSATFGDFSTTGFAGGAGSSSTRALFMGGRNVSLAADTKVSEYFTIASTGNSSNFGNLDLFRVRSVGVSNSTRAVDIGGYQNSPFVIQSTTEFFTIATTGNATSFGNLLGTMYSAGAASNSHGGL
jgi:hypothetical protein